MVTITNRRQTYGIARKSQTTITRHQEDKLSSLPHQDDCKTRTDIKLVSKPPPPEQSDTKFDSSPLVSNSLILMGLTFQAIVRPSVYSQIGHPLASFLFYVVSIWLNMTYIMESLPGVLGNRKNDIYSRGTGNKGQILS